MTFAGLSRKFMMNSAGGGRVGAVKLGVEQKVFKKVFKVAVEADL